MENLQQEEAKEFYTKIAEFARENSITVNIISIAGEECDLETLEIVTAKTGGDIERVKAEKLTENFANIFSTPIIATDVRMKVYLHTAMEFRNEEEEFLNEQKNIFTKEYGNVTSDSEVTFEYKVKSVEELRKSKDFDIKNLSKIYFQTQIFYTKLDGMKCIKVSSHVQEISHDREELEKEADVEMIGVNFIQQSAKLGRGGKFMQAQAYMKGQQKYWKGRSNVGGKAPKEVKSHLRRGKGMYTMLKAQNEIEENEAQEDDKEEQSESNTLLKKDESSTMSIPKGGKGYGMCGAKRVKGKVNDEMVSKLNNGSKYNRKRKRM
mmetsp:Transcript_23213/g.20586  ORF Transcript_23213/g.20586 Transcript_23213/m.20586 type:complete len:322 (+) Transcript_23213:215-1180(+)|eukprot:CAMPEP_0205804276 /NCGR_PEP_ID=MMETSP0205-20121125/7142_1 /ASSEMBLY_ACC=CAM_ASM_000278 /TAXON_ID=36767 /ORGANISM="Euplotes focardii, Strain TN1" /LENGTH=321 /DNA_ID=CAMNT_0053073617 /DNA_START=195 /DNA_END=1160 /DNA_ORIENTATION=-